MSDTTIKVGLMGCGAVAQYGHIPAIINTPGLELYAIFDPNEDALKAMQDTHGIPHVFSSTEAFFKSGISAVTITSPAPCHKDNVLEAATYSHPVLCEKPLAMNATEGQAMIDAMRKANAPLHTAFCYRYSPAALKIRELVQANAIGDVRSLRLIYNWNNHGKYTTDDAGNKTIQKRREGRMLEGGPMVDCGTHQIDLAQFWLNSEVVNFNSHGAWVDEYEAPDHLYLHMDHANGAHTMVEMSYSYHHTAKSPKSEFIYELIGSEGVIRYDRAHQCFTMETSADSQSFEFSVEKSFPGLYEAWGHFLQSGDDILLTSAHDGMRVTDIAREATNMAIKQRPQTD